MQTTFARFCSLLILLAISCSARSIQPVARQTLEKFLESYLQAPVLSPGIDQRYRSAFVQLKDDGSLQVIVYLRDRSWCGSGGCTTLILDPSKSGFELVSKIPITRLPIRVLETKTNGWHDLSVGVGGGGVPAHNVELVFDGRGYPANPSALPVWDSTGEVKGQVVLANELNEDGNDAITHVLQLQQDAWNRRDLEGFMAGYWNSPELTFFSGGKETRGWQGALDRYKAAYASPGHDMGKLEFAGLRIEMLGSDAAFVRGEYHLTMPDGKTPHGLFTLIFRKFPDGWKIVHDSSASSE